MKKCSDNYMIVGPTHDLMDAVLAIVSRWIKQGCVIRTVQDLVKAVQDAFLRVTRSLTKIIVISAVHDWTAFFDGRVEVERVKCHVPDEQRPHRFEFWKNKTTGMVEMWYKNLRQQSVYWNNEPIPILEHGMPDLAELTVQTPSSNKEYLRYLKGSPQIHLQYSLVTYNYFVENAGVILNILSQSHTSMYLIITQNAGFAKTRHNFMKMFSVPSVRSQVCDCEAEWTEFWDRFSEECAIEKAEGDKIVKRKASRLKSDLTAMDEYLLRKAHKISMLPSVKNVAIADELTKVTHVCPPVAPITLTKTGFSKVNTNVEAKFLSAFVDGSDDANALRAARTAMKKLMKPVVQSKPRESRAKPSGKPSTKRARSSVGNACNTSSESDDDVPLSHRIGKKRTVQTQQHQNQKKKSAKVQKQKLEPKEMEGVSKKRKVGANKDQSLVEEENVKSLVEDPQPHILGSVRRRINKYIAMEQPDLASAGDCAMVEQAETELRTSEIMGVAQTQNGDLVVGIEWEESQTCQTPTLTQHQPSLDVD